MAKGDAKSTSDVTEDDGLTPYERAQLAQQKAHDDRMYELAKAGATPAVKSPGDKTADELFQEQMRERRGQHLPPLKVEVVACKSPGTGSTFDAHVNHLGKVVEIPNYKHPEGHDVSRDDGGLVPSGMPIINLETGRPNKLYQKWLWENFYKADLITFVGKPLPRYARADFDMPAPQAAE